ncbi:MAG: hypothetical protein IKA79_03000 [Lentisphaeria bacterium]|nr:hypothetical protein [Lentisphaeria bacterium]
MKKLILPAVLLLAAVTVYAQVTETAPAGKAETKVQAQNKTETKAPAAVKSTAPAKRVPALTDPQSWTMVVVPDIQTYIKQIENQGILDMMLAWIVRRRDEMKIQQVLFTGDLVYFNDTGRVAKRDFYLKAAEKPTLWQMNNGRQFPVF